MRLRLSLFALLATLTLAAGALTALPAQSDPVIGPAVKVNNVAYAPGLPKLASVVDGSTSPLAWTVRDGGGQVVASGMTSVFGEDEASGDHVHTVDFSTVDTPGTGYTLEVAGQQSYPFDISAAPYEQLRYDALAFYYHQRSGIEIEAQFVGSEYARPAGHVNVPPNTGDDDVPCRPATPCDYTLDVRGGWYDAGDHGKYVVNGGISTWQLINAYERMLHVDGADGTALGDGTLAIPESSNGVPDILDEARWSVEFLLSMQVPDGQPQAGMAHHKIHDESWTGLPTLPHEDSQQRYLAPPSTAATLNLAAVAAQCARVWSGIDSSFAAECLESAETAYSAAQANPGIIADPNDGQGGGAYSDQNLDDEFYWAAAEMYATTGEQQYRDDLISHERYLGESFGTRGADWGNTGLLGDITLALVPNGLPSGDVTALRADFVSFGDTLLGLIDGQGYPAPYREQRQGGLWYDWGSNNLLLNNAVVLALAADFSGADGYRDGVFATLDYMMGRNPLNQSYISGYGEQAATNVHHRFWANQNDPSLPSAPPGVLAGGPNTGLNDPLAQQELSGCAPQKCYLDHIDSWSTNEVTINWNSVLSWVAVWAADNLPDDSQPEDTEPPSQPGTPAVSDVTATSAGVSWTASTDNVGVSGYDVYVDGSLETSAVSPSVTLGGLTPETTYQVVVVARDAAGNQSAPSGATTFTTDSDGEPGSACAVTYDSGPWTSGPGQGGFTAHVTITNTGDTTIDGWELEIELPDGQSLDHGWSATWTQDGQTVRATPLDWNATIAPLGSQQVGFNGLWAGSYTDASVFRLNGAPCE
ncbi:MAG TPA: glycoside hydrolase family 9 protein [Jiangellaceae bacterium]